MNLIQIKNLIPDYLLDNFSYQFVNEISKLLWYEINVFDIFNMVDIFIDFCSIAKY